MSKIKTFLERCKGGFKSGEMVTLCPRTISSSKTSHNDGYDSANLFCSSKGRILINSAERGTYEVQDILYQSHLGGTYVRVFKGRPFFVEGDPLFDLFEVTYEDHLGADELRLMVQCCPNMKKRLRNNRGNI